MKKKFITHNHQETQKLGEFLAVKLCGGEIICLDGDLGAGKTTFTQGLLRGLKVNGPYTSPTFLIMKHYQRQISNQFQKIKSQIQNIYHIDAYRINEKDLLNLGWEEISSDPKNIIIIEWSERVKKILPKNFIKIKFEWVDENSRKITFE